MFARKRLSLAILSTLIAAPTLAQAIELKAVEVEATTPASQTSATEASELVTNGNSETGTALRNINGVEGARMGGHGVDLFVRGQSQSQLNILLDGAKIEGGCPNRMDPPTAYAELNSYDEIIVTKGVATVTKGSGGTGGTVEFVRETPVYDPNKMVSGSVSAATSTNGVKHDVTAEVQAVAEKGYVVVQGNTKSADNYEDGNGNEVRSSYESQQGRVDLGWTPNQQHEVKLSYENTVIEDALFQGAMMDSPESDGTTLRLQYRGNDLRATTGFIDDIEIDVYQSEVDHIMDNYTLRPAGMSKMVNETNVTTDGAKIQLTSMIGHTQLDYGIQTETIEKLSTLKMASGMKSAYMWPQTEATTNSVFAESTSFFKDNQKVILGLRYDDFDSKATIADQQANPNAKTATQLYNATYTETSDASDNANDSQNLNGLIRYEKDLANNLNVYAGVSMTHRYADATELYMAKMGAKKDANGVVIARSDWMGNPNLEPEKHQQFDFGVSQSVQNFTWSASAFYDKVDNFIVRDFAKNQTASIKSLPAGITDMRQVYVNKDATLYGLDLEGQINFNQAVKVGGQLSYLRGQNDTDNRNLSNIAPINGHVFAEYANTNLMAGARLNFVQAQDTINTDFGELETAGYGTLDLYSSYQINKSFRVLAGVDNLMDKGYETYLNRTDNVGKTYKVYEPGRIIWARMNANF